MHEFAYRARDLYGREVRGECQADSFSHLMRRLKERDLILIESFNGNGKKRSASVPLSLKIPTRRARVGLRYVIPFTHYLKALHSSKMPLDEGLEDMEQYPPHPGFKKILRDMRQSMHEGNSLADSMARYPRTFSPVYVATVRMGEASGKLGEALARLSFYLERAYETHIRLFNAFFYPCILVVAILILLVLITTFLLPVLYDVYVSAGAALPVPSMVILNIGNWLSTHWREVLMFTVAGIIFLILSRKIEPLRTAGDTFVMHVPFVRTLLIKDAASTYSFTLSTMHRSGVEISECMAYSEATVSNLCLRKKLKNTRNYVENGRSLSISLRKTNAFPPLAISMIRAGENSGTIDESLDKICEFYDREIPFSIQNFITVFQAVYITIAVGIVGYIFFYSIIPIYSLVRVIIR